MGELSSTTQCWRLFISIVCRCSEDVQGGKAKKLDAAEAKEILYKIKMRKVIMDVELKKLLETWVQDGLG